MPKMSKARFLSALRATRNKFHWYEDCGSLRCMPKGVEEGDVDYENLCPIAAVATHLSDKEPGTYDTCQVDQYAAEFGLESLMPFIVAGADNETVYKDDVQSCGFGWEDPNLGVPGVKPTKANLARANKMRADMIKALGLGEPEPEDPLKSAGK